MSELQKRPLPKILDATLEKLGEHFDSVQILTTWTEGQVSKSQPRGTGDWYARQGAAHEFIARDQSEDLADMIAERLTSTDEGDDWKASETK